MSCIDRGSPQDLSRAPACPDYYPWRETMVGHWVRSGYGRGYLLEPESCVMSPGPAPRAARLIIAQVPPPHSLGAPPSGDQDTCIVPSLHAGSGGRHVSLVDSSLVSAQAGRTRRFSKMVASKMFNPFISRAVIVWPLIGAERGPPCGASLRLLILQTYWVLLPALGVPIVWAERAARSCGSSVCRRL